MGEKGDDQAMLCRMLLLSQPLIASKMERMFGSVLRSGGFWWFLLGTSKRLGAGRL